jgi:hypothetical protein
MNPTRSREFPLARATLALVALAGCSGEVLVDGTSGVTTGEGGSCAVLAAATDDYITHAYFGIAGPKQLLAVVGKVSYWATAKGVRAYDVEDINAPKLLDFHADADFGEGLAALIAEDPTQLAVVDAEGRLYVIPLGSSGPVAPLKTYLGEPAPGSTGSCGSP